MALQIIVSSLVVHKIRLLSEKVAKRDKNGILDDRRRNFTSNKVNFVTIFKIFEFSVELFSLELFRHRLYKRCFGQAIFKLFFLMTFTMFWKARVILIKYIKYNLIYGIFMRLGSKINICRTLLKKVRILPIQTNL